MKNLAWMILFALAGCGDDDGVTSDAGPRDTGAPVDAGVDAEGEADASAPLVDAGVVVEPLELHAIEAGNAVDADDPRYQGMLRFLWETWGAEKLYGWPPAEFMLDLMESEPEVFGEQFAAFGFTPDPDDDFPVGFKRGIQDPELVAYTCALCHVGRLPDGTPWLGLPNGQLDLNRFRVEVNERWVAAGNDPIIGPRGVEKAALHGPGRMSAETDEASYVVSVDFPPYFGLGDRTFLNYVGATRDARSEAYLSIYGLGPGSPAAAELGVEAPAEELIQVLLSFFNEIDAPTPPAQDETLVAMGETIFTRERCAGCHSPEGPGTGIVVMYDWTEGAVEHYPGEMGFERGTIRTSKWHRVLIDGDPTMPMEDPGSDDGFVEYFQYVLRKRLAVNMSDGYRAADLRGLWATAPYLHNGSVPTLEDLLRPATERPATFERNGFTIDTSIEGNSNQGHEFSVTLSDDERAALVAYLRTL